MAQEAAKQCGRSRLPDLDSPQPVAKLLAVAELPRLILIPTLAVAARPIKDVLAELTSRPRKKTAGGSGFGAVGSGQKLFSDGDCLPGPQPRTPNPEPTGVFQQSAGSNEVLILIGPEGDFAPAEIELARSRGARPVSLGPWTLRAETAAVVSVAVVQYALARAA
ncbi:MAG: RNA methyltransferase [Candidatus Omnitrophica bacterium]|nr:RNA methyltransferase [Candidatus Omnitrophota bacterium]